MNAPNGGAPSGTAISSTAVATTRSVRAADTRPEDPDAIRRRKLLEKLVDDRSDLRKVARSVRHIAQTVETAQHTLVLTRRSLRWLLLAGSAAALTLWVTRGRRSNSTLAMGLSMQVLHRWLKPAAHQAAPLSTRKSPAAAVGVRPT